MCKTRRDKVWGSRKEIFAQPKIKIKTLHNVVSPVSNANNLFPNMTDAEEFVSAYLDENIGHRPMDLCLRHLLELWRKENSHKPDRVQIVYEIVRHFIVKESEDYVLSLTKKTSSALHQLLAVYEKKEFAWCMRFDYVDREFVHQLTGFSPAVVQLLDHIGVPQHSPYLPLTTQKKLTYFPVIPSAAFKIAIELGSYLVIDRVLREGMFHYGYTTHRLATLHDETLRCKIVDQLPKPLPERAQQMFIEANILVPVESEETASQDSDTELEYPDLWDYSDLRGALPEDSDEEDMWTPREFIRS
jgi:hypothetical protein